METWQQWQEMARESERAAHLAESAGCYRSAASRYYYAAYQAATALLVYRGLTPPATREAWSHPDTPILIKTELRTLIPSRDRRNDLAARLKTLYALRVSADYAASRTVRADQAAAVRRDTGFILGIAEDVLPER
ncbi:MAG: HEPN domain-containing protein [Armatimonadota bacterium]|nr:HEPN domain-containing protein [Armatimonadota bacterium]